jgi:hypothetical protein
MGSFEAERASLSQRSRREKRSDFPYTLIGINVERPDC